MIRRFATVALWLLTALAITGCGKSSINGEERYVITEVIKEINGTVMTIDGPDGCFNVPMEHMEASPEPQVGDILEVVYDGRIEELYPSQFPGIGSLKVYKPVEMTGVITGFDQDALHFNPDEFSSLSDCTVKDWMKVIPTGPSFEVGDEIVITYTGITDEKDPSVLSGVVMVDLTDAGYKKKYGEQAGMPNPIVEYGSFEEINEVAGVNLMRPAVMGVSEERFSVISGSIAQYVCDINGMEWTFRGAQVTEEDISGIYHEYNTFTPEEDYTLYVNEFYLTRFFDGDRQYTIVVKDPISEDGEIIMDEETFMNCCMELESIQKYHMDDPLVGEYREAGNANVTAYIERFGESYYVSVNRFDSDTVFTCFNMPGTVKDGDRLTYRGEEIGKYTYDAVGNEISSDVTASNNLGYFEIRDGGLYWTGAAQEECRSYIFEKNNYGQLPRPVEGGVSCAIFDEGADIAEGPETALPSYVYSGNDEAEKAIIDYFEENNYLMKPEGSVWIPAFCIFMADAVSPYGEEAKKGDVKIYGNFWSFVYSKQGDILFCESGGEYPGVVYLWYKGGNEYEVSCFDRVGDGSQYSEDIRRICSGNESLEKQYYDAADGGSQEVKNKRTWEIYKYVKDNGLDIKYYQDYGWDPVDFNMEVNSWGNIILEGYEEALLIPMI